MAIFASCLRLSSELIHFFFSMGFLQTLVIKMKFDSYNYSLTDIKHFSVILFIPNLKIPIYNNNGTSTNLYCRI